MMGCYILAPKIGRCMRLSMKMDGKYGVSAWVAQQFRRL